MNEKDFSSRSAFVEVGKKVFGKWESVQLVANLQRSPQDVGANMRAKLYFLCSHQDHLPNLLVIWVMSKWNASITILLKWKYSIKNGGMPPF